MSRSRILVPVGILSMAAAAAAQSSFSQYGEILLSAGDQAPGLPVGYTLQNSLIDTPVMDQAGNILFRGKLQDTGGVGGLTTSNDRALFLGRHHDTLSMLLRADDPVPGIPGATFRSNSATAGSGTFAQDGCYRISPFSQKFFFRSNIYDAGNPAATPTTADEALFHGTAGSFALVCREGDEVPFFGAGSGIFWGTMSSSSWGLEQQLNEAGQITVANVMTGAVTTANDSILAAGFPGSLQVVSREGDVLSDGSVVTVASGTFLSSEVTINELGWVLHDMKFSSATGTATAANDLALALWINGSDTIVAREGQQAPGLPAGVLWASPSNAWSVLAADQVLTRSGETFLLAQLNGGGITANVDDFALYRGGLPGWTLIVQRNQPAPASLGAGVTYNTFSASTMTMNDDGVLAFTCQLNNTGATTNNTALIYGTAGNLRVLGREGDPVVAQGLSGGPWTCGDLFNTSFPRLNARGQLLWTPSITDGTTTKTVALSYDPTIDVWSCVYDRTETIAVPLGSVTIASTQTTGATSSGDGGVAYFNNSGDYVLKFSTTPTTSGPFIGRGRIGTMTCGPSALSTLTGGVHTLRLDAGLGNAGNYYAVAASGYYGVRPGSPFVAANGTFTIPLNQDWILTESISALSVYPGAPWGTTLGQLDINGRGTATLTIPANVPQFQGLDIVHAFVVIDLGLDVLHVGGACGLELY